MVNEADVSHHRTGPGAAVLLDQEHNEEECMFGTWMKLALNTSMLALETQQVIGLRILKLTLGGPAASREANRMVAEKMIAFGEAASKAATEGTAGSVIKGYRKRVRANRRRLSK